MRTRPTLSGLCLLVACSLLSIAVWLTPTASSEAAVPHMINYQGKLTGGGGGCLNDTVQMRFSIYPDTLGSPAVWTETQNSVIVKEGIFNVLLGSNTPISASVFDGSTKYLGVQVESDPEMRPLKPMVSVAYAFHSAIADSAFNVPVAGILSVDGVSNPGGDVDLIQTNAITITPSDPANTIIIGETHSARTDNPHQTTAAQTGALVGVDGVSNAGGNVDFVAGTNMTITPNDGANTITFAAAGGIDGSGIANYISKFTGSTTLGNSVIYETGANVGIGTTSPNEQLQITGNLRLPATTATAGIIKVGTDRFIHDFGTGNTFVGLNAGNLTMTGHGNTANGFQALYSNTTGKYSTANGYQALFSNTTGNHNTANGYMALLSNTIGYCNTATGYQALYSNTEGHDNTANGYMALHFNTTGYQNTANGWGALYYNTEGHDNTATGYQALHFNKTGHSNTAYGQWALCNDSLHSNNTGVGYLAGDYFTFTNSTFLGAYAYPNADGYDNSMCLGYGSKITASNQVRVGNSSVTSIGGQVGWTTLSDGRYKRSVSENVPGLSFISKLKPVTYTMDVEAMDAVLNPPHQLHEGQSEEDLKHSAEEMASKQAQSQIVYTGFIAQEVEKAAQEAGYNFSGVDAPKNDKDMYGLRYAEFVVPLVKAVQEQQQMIQEQQQMIYELQKRIEELEKR